MSHSHIRHEKDCLNCGTAPLIDDYCHHCGQRNVVPRQSVWHLVTHVFNDITHFDGKFFSTLKMLLLKPGYLSDAYRRGQRTKYLDPVRMYLFISFVFFFVVYNSIALKDTMITLQDRAAMQYMDSLRAQEMIDGIQFQIVSVPDYDKPMSVFNVESSMRYGRKHYDSFQTSLPKGQRQSWVGRIWDHAQVDAYQTYLVNPYNFVPTVYNTFIKSLSKSFFISLPIFAFFLFLFNLNRRREWYYVSHAIFAIHYYCVAFILLTVLLLLEYINLPPVVYETIVYVFFGGILIYLLLALKRFYKQGWWLTLFKYIVLLICMTLTQAILLAAMFLNALAISH